MQLWVTVFSDGSHLHRMCRQSCLKVLFVVKWIDCFRAVCLCMCVCECVWVSLCAVNKICSALKPWLTECSCMYDGYTQIFSTGYWVRWVVMATGETLFTMILFLFLLNKDRSRMQMDSPHQMKADECEWN